MGISSPLLSGVGRARRRQQSEPGGAAEPLAAPRSWAMPPRRPLPVETGATLPPLALVTPSQADVIVVGVPGIGKAAVCEFLTRHGLKAANVELERGRPLPEPVTRSRGLCIGLMMRPDRLIAERRMRTAAQPDRSADIDPQAVRDELIAARRLFTQSNWHIMDISHQSPSAVAARIVALLQRRQG